MTSHYRQLVLTPTSSRETLPSLDLAAALTELRLIDAAVSPQWPHRYYIGERFLQYLSFMGCAPALEFKPKDPDSPDWAAFTYVSFTLPLRLPRCYIDTMMAKPRCPHCGKRHACSAQMLTQTSELLVCPKCQQSATLEQWDWREYGGCAQQFISIVNVYPKEAIPTESLLQDLFALTHLHWRYFYINNGLLDS